MLKKHYNSVRLKLFLSLFILTVIISIVLIFAIYSSSRAESEKALHDSFNMTLSQVCSSTNNEVSKFNTMSSYFFASSMVKNAILEGNLNSEKANSLKVEMFDLTWQYAATHLFDEINSISIKGYNGYYFNQCWNNDDNLPSWYLTSLEPTWTDMAKAYPNQIIWLGHTSRPVIPGNPLSPVRDEISFIRTIKDHTYAYDIGYMYVCINPERFISHIFSDNMTGASGSFYIVCNGDIVNPPENQAVLDLIKAALSDESAYSDSGKEYHDSGASVFCRQLNSRGWTIVGILPTAASFLNINSFIKANAMAIIASILIALSAWILTSVFIIKPMSQLNESIRQIESGHSEMRIPIQSEDEFGYMSQQINQMLDRLHQLHEANLTTERLVNEAEYRALQAQLNPHFMFNTLNTIRIMAMMIHAGNIRMVVDSFWDITKYCTNNKERFVTINEEIHIARQYIHLQEIAYPNRFTFTASVDDAVTNIYCIKFILQPLIENSLMHGILPHESDMGSIYLSIYLQDKYLVINIHDDGIGMGQDTIDLVQSPEYGKLQKKAGLANIIERLRYAYEDCHIDITSREGFGTNIMIQLPILLDNPEESDSVK